VGSIRRQLLLSQRDAIQFHSTSDARRVAEIPTGFEALRQNLAVKVIALRKLAGGRLQVGQAADRAWRGALAGLGKRWPL